MIGWLIIACEIGFWVFVAAGLTARYILRKKTLGSLLLLCTPVIDLILIAATTIDLHRGAEATIFHGIAAVYIGITVAYGKQMVHWADERFAYKFGNGSKPAKPPKYGSEHARRERNGWYRHLLAWIIGLALLFAMILFIGNSEQTENLQGLIKMWTLVLAIDFAISFSYTVWPRKGKAENSKITM
ncbi:hypothetical protein ACOSZF_07450 [Cytobacillus firmus]|uniref:Putative membrane protein n=1 Tax=Cytobacillus firmus TaxID=1399 RepID=A0A380XT48_CYTFI|nr:hypothetical protein [Cytobacillus firmus]KAF0824562.1 putative membrane protein [Cytobacillus firmus]MBG9545318.1 membrane protein [Cytobacillus firmus]MBG9548224.1 membrane protein [Cytobacillus firmus]MBG9554588.1 membrane protein [Cytobacillus firmus]MBG9576467.1 membrane protein [Cytobacillus firmus]